MHDIWCAICYIWQVIRSFRHKGLKELFARGFSGTVAKELQARCLRRLTVIDNAVALGNINVPGFNFHPMRGKRQRYSVHVNGPWCITFEWDNGDALRINLEQYH